MAAMVIDLRRARLASRSTPSGGLITTISAAVLIGTGLAMIYGVAVGGRVRLTQVLLAIYFACGLLLILKAFDYLMRRALARVLRTDAKPGEKSSALWRGVRDGISFAIRVVVLIAIGLPYVMAAVMTYRPKVLPADDPQKQLGYEFERVSFRTDDRLNISGWWIPAIHESRRRAAPPDFATRTVIICHGLGSSKSNQLMLAGAFVPAGYNVLIFDFRAHGESDGQLSSFGDLERRDVLAAVRWLRENRPGQSREIFGLGASMGGAALIAAAADPSPEGQAIQSIAVLDTYDSLDREMRDVARNRFPQPIGWAINQFALPMASAQVGANLADFAPAELVLHVWPRPILIIHGTRDPIIGLDRGRQLFNAACQPKDRLWIEGADHNSILNDDAVLRRVRQFFESAQPVPVI
jgi:alpha-beta hydrolase superfamily lysophospholipase